MDRSAEGVSAAPAHDRLLRIDRYLEGNGFAGLADDVRAGLSQPQKVLPPKYFYDDYGSRLFDAICDLPEYYLTRTEYALLQAVSDEIIALVRPTHLIELGSGASRKTRVLLDALTAVRPDACYVALDVNETMLRRSAADLRQAYPALRIHGIVGDYEHHITHLPSGPRRLVIFLGSTLGNFTPAEAVVFLRSLTRRLAPGDFVLLGLDLVKAIEVLHAAYNDGAGVTAEFNRNMLRVLNRELGANFELDRFEHVAFFNVEAAQIEMHLRACEAHVVDIARLNLAIPFAEGETIRTEISRKFTRSEAEEMLATARCPLVRWYPSAERYFALALGSVPGRS